MLLTRQKVVDESSEGIVCHPNRVVNHFASKLLLIVLFLLRRTTSLLLLAHLVEKNKGASDQTTLHLLTIGIDSYKLFDLIDGAFDNFKSCYEIT